jgi:hypothetical protein
LAAAKRPRRFTGLGEKSLEGGQFAHSFCRVTRGEGGPGGEQGQTRPRESLNQVNVEQAQSAQQALINEKQPRCRRCRRKVARRRAIRIVVRERDWWDGGEPDQRASAARAAR